METNFLVTPRFDKSYKKLKKKYPSLPADIAQFKKDFAENKGLGISLGGGYRKIRMAIHSKDKGKSGGARIITYELCLKTENNTIVLVDIYDKAERETIQEAEYTQILQSFIFGL
ncbi:MAG: addiction module toxin RelE [Dysgonamonadaceae bacterium]|jgi:mRNA-degrading endonuclease RelE of RelBE toxin-antitoxin system|nr:addiction module toxin RelE [Dysgonamonadaceae bacterium]